LVPSEKVRSTIWLKFDEYFLCRHPMRVNSSGFLIREVAELPIIEPIEVETSHTPRKRAVHPVIEGLSYGDRDYPRGYRKLPKVQVQELP
jgi:hypothetical protein